MALSAHDRQALRSIEGSLAISAPGLASRLAMFTRLTAGEALPVRESVRAGGFRGEARRRLLWPALLLVVSFALIAVGLAVRHGPPVTCTALAPSCVWHAARYSPRRHAADPSYQQRARQMKSRRVTMPSPTAFPSHRSK
jgi:hypothetical protein